MGFWGSFLLAIEKVLILSAMARRNRFRVSKLGDCFLFAFAKLLPRCLGRTLMRQDAFQKAVAKRSICYCSLHGRKHILLEINTQ